MSKISVIQNALQPLSTKIRRGMIGMGIAGMAMGAASCGGGDDNTFNPQPVKTVEAHMVMFSANQCDLDPNIYYMETAIKAGREQAGPNGKVNVTNDCFIATSKSLNSVNNALKKLKDLTIQYNANTNPHELHVDWNRNDWLQRDSISAIAVNCTMINLRENKVNDASIKDYVNAKIK
jgi:hypothetical protein